MKPGNNSRKYHMEYVTWRDFSQSQSLKTLLTKCVIIVEYISKEIFDVVRVFPTTLMDKKICIKYGCIQHVMYSTFLRVYRHKERICWTRIYYPKAIPSYTLSSFTIFALLSHHPNLIKCKIKDHNRDIFCCIYSYSFNVFRNTKEVINNDGLNAVTTKRITFTTLGSKLFQPWQW